MAQNRYASLLDLSNGLNIDNLRFVVQRMSCGTPAEITEAQDVLTQLKELPEVFAHIAPALAPTVDTHTRFFALQVLQAHVTTKWNIFPPEQRMEIRNFVIRLIVQECASLAQMRASKALLTKMNTTLVAIAKREWPQRWPTFVSDVVQSCPPTDPMMENNLHVLRILGEEVFEFGEKTMTSRWIQRKKQALQADMRLIYSTVTQLLALADSTLLNTALGVLDVYIPLFPLNLVFDKPLFEYLSTYAVTTASIRVNAVKCLTSIFTVDVPVYDEVQACLVCIQAFEASLKASIDMLPTNHGDISDSILVLYNKGSENDRAFIDVVIQMILQLFKRYGHKPQLFNSPAVEAALKMVVGATFIDDKELFKTCVDFWWHLGEKLLRRAREGNPGGAQSDLSNVFLQNASPSLRMQVSNARTALIRKMAKPEEVIIVEEEGEIRREFMTDVETLHLYTSMREALVFLTHLHPQDTRNIMTKLMERQLNRVEWSWANCSHLSWAVGAVAGSMSVEEEKDLFVSILRDLLSLCSRMQGKDNRAVIASNIMYVVGRYPRFLERHPSFVFTVCRKLFEFMTETFPGVQDMAVETFLKLCRLVPLAVVNAVDKDGMQFLRYICANWSNIISSLTTPQMHTTYKAVGYLIFHVTPSEQPSSLDIILSMSQSTLRDLCGEATARGGAVTSTSDFMRALIAALRCFSNMASSCGSCFITVMTSWFAVLKLFYEGYSSELNALAAAAGPNAVAALMHQQARLMRLVKREILRILEVFVDNTNELTFVAETCMPAILSLVLVDYNTSHAAAKEPGVLALATACLKRLTVLLAPNISAILDHTFDTTVAIITANMEDHPELRVELFRMIQAMNAHCFEAFLATVSLQDDVINGMLWAIKHTETTMMSVGLETMFLFLQKVRMSPVAFDFFSKYMQKILEDVMVAAMDSLHAAGFQLHCKILMEIFSVSRSAAADVPVVGPNAVMQFLVDSLSVIETLSVPQKQQFVSLFYESCDDQLRFRTHFADFLIEVQVWGAEEENKLIEDEQRQAREQMVPGLAAMDALAGATAFYNDPNNALPL